MLGRLDVDSLDSVNLEPRVGPNSHDIGSLDCVHVILYVVHCAVLEVDETKIELSTMIA